MTAERLFRVDPRLVHATMMNVWVPTTGARALIVADARLVVDSTKRAILEMSAMGLVDVRFVAETEVGPALAACDPHLAVIVLFSDLEGVEAAVEAGLEIDRLNLGHVPEGPGRTEVLPPVHLGPADFEIIERLQAKGLEVFMQPLPNDRATVIPRRSSERPSSSPPPPSRAEARLRVVNDRGLHLRAAHVLAHLAGGLPCEVQIGYPNQMVNAKSLLGLTTLGATCGTLLDVHVDGADAAGALGRIRDLFATGFDEGVHWVGDSEDER